MIPSPLEMRAAVKTLQALAERYRDRHAAHEPRAASDRYLTITAEPQCADPYYPRNPSGWYYTGPITTLRGRRPKGLRDGEHWLSVAEVLHLRGPMLATSPWASWVAPALAGKP